LPGSVGSGVRGSVACDLLADSTEQLGDRGAGGAGFEHGDAAGRDDEGTVMSRCSIADRANATPTYRRAAEQSVLETPRTICGGAAPFGQ
jgi:hypothetical protein